MKKYLVLLLKPLELPTTHLSLLRGIKYEIPLRVYAMLLDMILKYFSFTEFYINNFTRHI